MRLYAVFLPPNQAPLAAADKAELVPQGFSWGAFLLTPFWAMRQRLWLAFALWLFWVFVVACAAFFGHLRVNLVVSIYALGALAFGFEADRFHEARLARSGFLLQGLALGRSLAEAERFYFRRRPKFGGKPPPFGAQMARAPVDPGDSPKATTGEADFLGLFPPRETGN
jgi:hypothetical protein